MNRLKIALLFLFISIGTTYGQQHELGLSIGGVNYIGDIGRETYFHPNKLSGSIFYTSVINPWFSSRMNFSYIALSANDSESESLGRRARGLSFSTTSLDVALGIEYKFFPRNPYVRQKGSRRFSPYLFSGLSMGYFNGVLNSKDNKIKTFDGAALNIPMLFGIKYKVGESFLIGLETGVFYHLTDNLDGTGFVYGDTNRMTRGGVIPTTNINSNDWHTYTSISLIYSFGDLRCYFGF